MTQRGPSAGFAEVLESEATGEIAAIYADIRETMAMSFVNLIWRKLALSPEGLRWTWETMKPLYAEGSVYAEAVLLRDGQDLPEIPQLPRSVLRAVGVDASAVAQISAALGGYDRGNPLNLVAFSAVLTRLESTSETEGEAVKEVPDPNRVAAMRRSTPPAPRMQSFDEMDPITAELVQVVSPLGGTGTGRAVRVSLPRNLAHWPGFLSLYYAVLAPLDADGRLGRAVDAVLADGDARGRRLAAHLGETGLPPEASLRAVLEPIESLVPHAMGRMIPVVSLLQRMLTK